MSLHGTYDADNVFAKILRGELPCIKVAETADTLAFMDLFPQSRGHTLVIPKALGARTLLDLPPRAIAPLFQEVQRVALAIETALKPDGLIVTQFNGGPAGQTVFHLHVHLIPRWDGEALKGHGQAGKADTATLQALAGEISAALPPVG
jgi:histidine triad (HIT) family protein